MKRRLFNIAWSVVKSFNSFSEALAHAWKVIRLQAMLVTQSLVTFKYKKVDGSIREAKGSNADIPYTGEPRKKPVNHSVLTYWDLEANDFRCAKIELLLF